MGKQTLSVAEELYRGKANYAPVFGRNGRAGVPCMIPTKIDMGSPIVGDPNGHIETENLTALGVWSVSSTFAAAIAAYTLLGVNDYPRNIVAAWTGTAVLTITGTDEYDNVIVESSASGTSLTGKKAFKTITNITTSGDITGLTVGTGDVLGIPYFLTHESDVLGFYADTTEEKLASVFVAGVTTVATATTGDVRGTVNPDTTLDGSVNFYLWMYIRETDLKSDLVGVTQYAG